MASSEQMKAVTDVNAVMRVGNVRLDAPESESGPGWPGVVRFALENWPRTVRLCVIVVVFGAVLLLAGQLGFLFWI